MRQLKIRLLCALLTVLFMVPAISFSSSAESKITGEYLKGEVIVRLKNSAESACLKKKNAEKMYGNGVELKSSSVIEGRKKLRFITLKSSEKSTEELICELEKNENVEYAFPNYIKYSCALTDDTYSDYQWALRNTGQEGGTAGIDTDASAAWKKAKDSGEQVVAVIDSGIDFEHEDLKDVLWTNPYESELKGVHGYDFTGTNRDGRPVDDVGHGTHIAGIIAASADNGKGISGINRSNVRIMALKASVNGRFSTSSELKAFEYIENAKKLGVNITAVNCSYCGESDIREKQNYDTIFDNLGALGIVTCVASGNCYKNLSDHTNGKYQVPACTDSEFALTVSASDERDRNLAFSNYGEEYVDLAAPGANILSTVNYNCYNPTVYDSEKLSDTTTRFFSFDSETLTDIVNVSGDVKLTLSDEFIGLKGDSLRFSPNTQGASYFVEIPYTLGAETGDYYLSFMSMFPKDSDCFVADVPIDFEVSKHTKYIMNEDFYFGSYGDNSWDHFVFGIDTSDSDYLKGTERKLVFYVSATEGDFYLDDVGVSAQNVDEEIFGKYDYMKGTSMSCPFVAGAAALIKSVYPDYSASDVIKALKTSARHSDDLVGKVKDGATLCLSKLGDIEPSPTQSAVEKKTALSLSESKKKLYVGKTYTVKPKIVNLKGAVTYKSSDSKVAAVSSKGNVRAVRKGTAYITVSNNGASKKLKITVINPKLNKKSMALKKGKTFKLKITGKVGKARFKSSNKKVASVSSKGKIKAKSRGKAIITVTTNGKIKLKCKIKVK